MDLSETEANNINSLICFLMPGKKNRSTSHGFRRCRRYVAPIRPHPNIILDEPTWDTTRDCIPESRDPGNFPIPKSRDWGALNPGISGLTKFIYLTVLLVLFKIILCIYSLFDAFLSPQWGGGGRCARAEMHVFVCFFTYWTANATAIQGSESRNWHFSIPKSRDWIGVNLYEIPIKLSMMNISVTMGLLLH